MQNSAHSQLKFAVVVTDALLQQQEDQDDSNEKRSIVKPTALKIVADDMRNHAKADERPER